MCTKVCMYEESHWQGREVELGAWIIYARETTCEYDANRIYIMRTYSEFYFLLESSDSEYMLHPVELLVFGI